MMDAASHLCHRCASPLPEQSLFCPHCGAPQLELNETDAQRIAVEQAAAPASGAAPLRLPGTERIRWRPALRALMVIALVAGLPYGLGDLFPAFGLLGLMLILLGPTLSLSFYQRRVPGAPMGAGVGARIGLVFGLFLSLVVALSSTAASLIDRYLLRHGARMDEQLTAAVQKMAAYPAFAANPVAAQQMLHLYQTPDGRAGMALAGTVMIACFVLGYCILSCALLGWLRPMAARRPAA